MQSSLKWNLELKPSSNIYTIFDMIFEELFMIFFFLFVQVTYGFEAKKFKSLTL